MKTLADFRDGALAQNLAREIRRIVTRPWAIMEICGGQTHSILRHGIDQILPPELELIHGPGCPVCVTPIETIDHAQAIAALPGVLFCSFGDMLRVPGSREDLLSVRARGADVRMVYSPLDALKLARENPAKQVVFFGIGFETTAPATAMAVFQARRLGITNVSMLVSHVLVPPAIEAVMSAPDNRVQAFLAAGHVCAVMGYHQYPPLAQKHRIPIVITGFEPLDLLEGIRRAVHHLESGSCGVENGYGRVVTLEGNQTAQAMLATVFEETDREWRGLGVIPKSGWKLRKEFAAFDAAVRFPLARVASTPPQVCRSGEVLRGVLKPSQCPAFGRECTPRTPLGATMVSGEGACAAYFQYGKLNETHSPIACPK